MNMQRRHLFLLGTIGLVVLVLALGLLFNADAAAAPAHWTVDAPLRVGSGLPQASGIGLPASAQMLTVTTSSLENGVAGAQGVGAASVPNAAMSYQGRLLSNGAAYNGIINLGFRLYTVPTGGAESWVETQTVTVTNGLFSVMLGAVNPLSAVSFASQLYLGVQPAGAAAELTPRQPVGAAGYALSLVPGATMDDASSGAYVASLWLHSTSHIALYSISESSYAIKGISNATSGASDGIYGQTFSNSGAGVRGTGPVTGTMGVATGAGGTGVDGEARVAGGTGVYALAALNGVKAEGTATGANGVIGIANNGSNAYAIWGQSSSGFAGYFTGNVQVTGNLNVDGAVTAGGVKPFRIDNPLDPQHQYLYHYAVESPQVENLYNGNVVLDAQGEAVVQLPVYFSAVNNGDYTYSLTPVGAPMPNLYVAQEIQGNTFKIAGGAAGKKVSWTVFGHRNDPWMRDHPQPDVAPKPAEEIGTFLYPQGYGQSQSLGAEYVQEQKKLSPAGQK